MEPVMKLVRNVNCAAAGAKACKYRSRPRCVCLAALRGATGFEHDVDCNLLAAALYGQGNGFTG